jgi:hypothetical protein
MAGSTYAARVNRLLLLAAVGCTEHGESPDACTTSVFLDGTLATTASREIEATHEAPAELCLELDARGTTSPLAFRATVVLDLVLTLRGLDGGVLADGVDAVTHAFPAGTSTFAVLELAVAPPTISARTQVELVSSP